MWGIEGTGAHDVVSGAVMDQMEDVYPAGQEALCPLVPVRPGIVVVWGLTCTSVGIRTSEGQAVSGYGWVEVQDLLLGTVSTCEEGTPGRGRYFIIWTSGWGFPVRPGIGAGRDSSVSLVVSELLAVKLYVGVGWVKGGKK